MLLRVERTNIVNTKQIHVMLNVPHFALRHISMSQSYDRVQ